MDKKQTQEGFNLIELMIAVSIISILLSIGVPSYIESQKRNNADSNILKMKSAMNMAKQQAIYQAREIIICPPNNAVNGCGTNWSQGAIIFAAADATISGTTISGISDSEIISRIYGVKNTVGSFTSNKGVYKFGQNGFSTTPGAITYCDASNSYGKTLSISSAGKVTLQDFSCS